MFVTNHKNLVKKTSNKKNLEHNDAVKNRNLIR